VTDHSPIAVSTEVELKSDDLKDMKIYGSDLPERYRQLNYCELNSKNDNEQCKIVLSGSLKSKPHWHFFGDSQMAYVFQSLKTQYPYEVSVERGQLKNGKDRCKLSEYLNVEKSNIWKKPDIKLLQGPVKAAPFCSDMNGWGPNMVGNEEKSIEYFNIEFAQDVEVQTQSVPTTQEAAALYLTNENKDDHVCVVNTGLHDQIVLNSDTPPDQFLNNVRWYLKLLDSVCGNLVWVGLTAVAEIDDNPQRNSLSLEWNKQVYSALASDYKNNSFVIDVWEESDAAPFRGGRQNIHFEYPYYVSFASLYASLV